MDIRTTYDYQNRHTDTTSDQVIEALELAIICIRGTEEDDEEVLPVTGTEA